MSAQSGETFDKIIQSRMENVDLSEPIVSLERPLRKDGAEGNSIACNIPSEIRDILGLEVGQQIEFGVYRGFLIVAPKEDTDEFNR